MRTGDNRRSESTRRSGNANDKEESETTERRLKTNGQWTRHLGVRESGTVEGWVKRVKHVGNEEEASESTSNDAIVVLVGQSVGPLRGERAPGEKKLRLSAADFVW